MSAQRGKSASAEVVLPPVDTDGVDGPPIGPVCKSCGGNDGYGPSPHHAPDCYFASREDAECRPR